MKLHLQKYHTEEMKEFVVEEKNMAENKNKQNQNSGSGSAIAIFLQKQKNKCVISFTRIANALQIQ